MSRNRTILALALGLFLVANAVATPHVFMGFDTQNQRMFAVVKGDPGDPQLYAYCTLDQSNPGGWIDPAYNSFGEADPEAVFETNMSPDDPARLGEIPEGEANVITALVDLYDADYNYLYTVETHDTLASDSMNGMLGYVYQDDCAWVLPDTIRINTAFCATICHGSASIPIFCEDPNYNPDLLEVTVTNGCLASETHCNNPDCAPVDPALFSWWKRVFPGCHLYLGMTYCGEGPGCVCIWRSDFYLPVEMNGFTAVAGDHSVALNWLTRSESDLNGFRISRSTRPDDGYMQISPEIQATNEASGHSYTWVDNSVTNGVTYYYKLHVIDANGAHVYNDGSRPVIAQATPGAGLAADYVLAQNFPNPFNLQTSFSYSLAAPGHVSLKVFDVLGREVATVVDAKMDAGRHSINWNAEGLASGVYVYTLKSEGFSDSKKLLFLK